MAIAIEEKSLPASEGMKLALTIIKLEPLAALIGKSKTQISNGITHSIYNGKKYYFTEDEVLALEKAVHDVGYTLLNTTLTTDRTTDSAYCTGLTVLDKIQCLGRTMRLPYIFFEQMHWSTKQKTMRLSQRDGACYGKFTEEHIEQINKAIRMGAYTLLGLHLEYEQPQQ